MEFIDKPNEALKYILDNFNIPRQEAMKYIGYSVALGEVTVPNIGLKLDTCKKTKTIKVYKVEVEEGKDWD